MRVCVMDVPEGCEARVVGFREASWSRERKWAHKTAKPAVCIVELIGQILQPGDVIDNHDSEGDDEPCVWSASGVERLRALGIDHESADACWHSDGLRRRWMVEVPLPGSEALVQARIDRAKVEG